MEFKFGEIPDTKQMPELPEMALITLTASKIILLAMLQPSINENRGAIIMKPAGNQSFNKILKVRRRFTFHREL